MKRLFVAHGYNEPDNNTPSDEILARVVDIEPDKQVEWERAFEKELEKTYPIGVNVKSYSLEQLQDDWAEVITIW